MKQFRVFVIKFTIQSDCIQSYIPGLYWQLTSKLSVRNEYFTTKVRILHHCERFPYKRVLLPVDVQCVCVEPKSTNLKSLNMFLLLSTKYVQTVQCTYSLKHTQTDRFAYSERQKIFQIQIRTDGKLEFSIWWICTCQHNWNSWHKMKPYYPVLAVISNQKGSSFMQKQIEHYLYVLSFSVYSNGIFTGTIVVHHNPMWQMKYETVLVELKLHQVKTKTIRKGACERAKCLHQFMWWWWWCE